MIAAPVDAVWAALTTKEGQESWNVAHAEIDLKIGGKMRTHYDAAGRIGDPNTIENTILCFEPRRMLAIQVQNPPEKFPYKNRDQEDVDRDLFRRRRPVAHAAAPCGHRLR